VDLPGDVPQDTLTNVAAALNERLAGLSLEQIQRSLPDRLRDARTDDAPADELINIFMQAGADLLDPVTMGGPDVHLGRTSVLAAQPEFQEGPRLYWGVASTPAVSRSRSVASTVHKHSRISP
jgi:hypothetical protein